MNQIVSEKLTASYRHDGYVVVPDLLSDEECERFGAAVDRAVSSRGAKDNRELTQKSPYEQSFTQCINLWEDFPDVIPLTFHPKISQAAVELAGVPALRLWHDQALYKQAGGRYTEPHQDAPYWPMDEYDTITAWIPFDGSTHESGCMAYVPGSHRAGLKEFVNIFKADESVKILENKRIESVSPVYVEVVRGAVAFHHGLTVHLAKPNLSNRARRVHTMIYFRDGAVRTKPYVHPSVDRPGIKVGDPIASDLTPIVWPRAAGDWPRPPGYPLTPVLAEINRYGALPNVK
jgi:ectoine hydroxylase-related dioxygenase (phytanoyl-CoA dioxygenase family)